ncbi:hypothetical protein [Paludibacter sp. 221]|nr:hypothetical protein [Paludibacter sp. 221]
MESILIGIIGIFVVGCVVYEIYRMIKGDSDSVKESHVKHN